VKKLLTGLLLLCAVTVFAGSDSLHAYTGLKRYPPFYDTISKRIFLRNEQAPFGRKVLLGSGEVLGYNVLITSLLFVLPRQISNWRNITAADVRQQYRRSFTRPPVVDGDVWYINYIGHPYQGACYYNALRSQGGKFWQAGLFSLGHSLIWEYAAEGGLEQPSIQDLIVTPIAGSLLGELIHFGTIRMSRNGFTWYEKVFVCLFNPMFAINNGFKYAGVPPRRYR
jgi:hypothetical protein